MVAERYRLEAVVALGGIGAVYRAEHVLLRRRVAVKILSPDAEAFSLLATRMEREGLVGAHLVHPNIAAALDFGTLEDGARYLVSEFVPGRTLRDVMKDGPLPIARAMALALQLVEALRVCHQRGVLHRDIKPGNVMVDEAAGDILKLIDFGLAQVPVHEVTHVDEDEDDADAAPTQQNLTVHGIVFGTIPYMAPETAQGMAAVDERSDLYAFGVILYEMLAGKHPFSVTDPAEMFLHHRVVTPPPFAERAPDVHVPPALEAVVQRLLAKRPDERFPNAAEVINALHRTMGSGASIPPSGSIRPVVLRSSHPTLVSYGSVPPPRSLPPGSLPPGSAQPPQAPRAEETPLEATRPPVAAPAASWMSKLRTRGARAATIAVVASVCVASILLRSRPAEEATAAEGDVTAPTPSAVHPEAAEVAAPDLDRAVKEAFARDQARRRFRESADKGKWTGATDALRELIVRDPNALATTEDRKRAAKVATRAALAEVSHAEELFDALAESSGQYGLDVLYDIVDGQGGTRAAELAWARLLRRDVRERANPQLEVAIALRDASCKSKSSLFERAGEQGDARARRLLARLRSNLCDSRRGECCYHGNDALERAIRSIEARD